MSGTHSNLVAGLPDVDKQKLRELASQMRADHAKRAQKSTEQFKVADGVSFGAPVKVAPNEHDIIQKRLGDYEVAKRLIQSSRTTKTDLGTDLLGVDRQPATPLPSKNPKDGFFPKSSRNPNIQKRLPDQITSSATDHRKEREKLNALSGAVDKHPVKLNEKGKDERYSNKAYTHRTNAKDINSSLQKGNNPVQASSSSQKVHNPVQTKESAHSNTEKPVSSHHPVVSTHKTYLHRRSHGESNHRSVSPSSVIGSQIDKSSAHSNVKEPVNQSKPTPQGRDSILSTFSKELGVNSLESQLKSATNSQSDRTEDLSKPNKASAKTRPIDSSILKVKEDNRNGMNTFNGRVRPTIHIPEKNVEDMLKELTHIPEPLTALHTPFKEGGKFPFQIPEKPNQASRDSKTTYEAPKEADLSSREVARTSASLDQIEPIASPNEEESEDSDSSSDSDSDGEVLEDGEIVSEDSDENVLAPAGSHTSLNRNTATKVSHPAPVSSGPLTKPTAAPVKEPRKSSSKMSSGSSDSSSSGSEDSNSSDSESDDDHVASDDEDDNQHKNETTPPKSKTSPLEEEESPSSASKQQKWSLKSFLPERDTSLLGPSSVKSVDNPWSNKSDANHYIDDVDHPIRPADQVISDDNPPSNIPDDHDIFSKPLSDEFSPPSLPYKHPITSPKFNVSDIQHKSQTFDVSPNTPTNVYDAVKARKRTPSLKSPEVPERVSTPRAKRSRKSKPVVLSSECSSSEDELDSRLNNTSQSADVKKVIKESPKPLPKSPRKSQNVSKTDSRSVTPSKASKKKESKQEKQTVEKDSVRLKSEGKNPASKAADCDKSVSDKSDLSLSSNKLDSESFEKIFDNFHKDILLSPIPNVPEKSHVASVQKDALPVPKEKSVLFNGSVTYRNGKPSVMVQIDLGLLRKYINLEDSKSMHKDDVSKVAILENQFTNSEDKTRTRLEPCSKPTAIEKIKPEKKRKSESAKVTSQDKLSSKLTSALPSNSESCDKLLPSVKISAKDSISKSADSSKGACATQKVLTSNSTPDYSSFESLPFRPSVEQPVKKHVAKKQQQQHTSLSDSSSDSDSSSSGSDSDSDSESDNEENHSVDVNTVSPVPEPSMEVCVQDADVKKRKQDSLRTEDMKRRRTASKSPRNMMCSDTNVKGDNYDAKEPDWSQKHDMVSSKERRSSSSSQHSNHSNHSTWSNLSQQGQGRDQGHSRKRAKLESGKESLSQLSASQTSDHISSSNKHPIKSDRPEPSEIIVNGHASQTSAPNSSNSTTEGNKTMVSPFWIRDQEERLEDANEYHIRARKAKHQADAMESGLQQNILYLEAALCFIQSGCAMERNHKFVGAANFFTETHRFVVHNPHFRMPHDPETADKAELKLAVLCLRVQSLLYLKLFMLKKTDTLKLKRALEDHHNKTVKSSVAGSQSKPPPSAPSPHQTWNHSTGTPSPMSPTPSPVGSVCSVGSVGSINEMTPSKSTNGTSPAPMAPAGQVLVPKRIHTITQRYLTSTNYLVSCHELWDQADSAVTTDIKDFFAQLDMDCGRLTMQSSLLHLVRYVKHGLQLLKPS